MINRPNVSPGRGVPLAIRSALLVLFATPSAVGVAGVVDELNARWDAAPRIIGGNERSLDGGLRYSASGGSFEAFRDQFAWVSTPSVAQFETAVRDAFGAWTAIDPVSGFGTTLNFIPDFSTSVATGSGFGTLDINGAEIDLIASDAGVQGFGGLTVISRIGVPVTLTSGVADYAPSTSIDGVDLHLNSNADTFYTLDIFRRLLTHELGHAIGLGDVDFGSPFIDDNYDPNDPLGTLTNSWIDLIDPLDPAGSPGLSTYSVAASDFQIAGVDILMESNGLGTGPGNPLSELFPLRNDDYAMRQYLYPVLAIPEPTSVVTLFILTVVAWGQRRRRVDQLGSV